MNILYTSGVPTPPNTHFPFCMLKSTPLIRYKSL